MTTSDFPTPATFEPLSADDPQQVGGYRPTARLGAGGMGRVYLAHTPAGRPVALKVVRPELAQDPGFRERFAQEVASARRIHGLYTAQVVDAGVDAALPWLATAYVPGPSLHQVVHRHGPLPERTVLLVMAGVAEALQAVHAAGVVHRDLKPGNVLLAADGPRVIDFGIARAADAGALTGTGLRIGSPGYMAPEQALGRPAGPATDVFALGALAVCISGGTPPFGDGPESVALYRAVHEQPDLSRVPPGLHQLLLHCLAKDPAHRPNPAQIIDAARRHPLMGGQLSFSEDWLPHPVSTEIRHRSELPTAFGPAPTVLAPAPAPAATAPAVPAPRRGGHRRTALAVTAALLVGAAGAFVLLDPADDEEAGPGTLAAAPVATPTPTATPTPAPSAAPTATGYTAVHTGVELLAPDSSYEFDLRAGKVVPQDAVSWYLGRSSTEFLVPEDSDSHIAPGDRLTPGDCVRGIESRLATALPFAGLGPGRTFCVRSRSTRDLVVVRVVEASPGDGPVRVSMDYYRHDG
ncbi:serine/threonine-protein kinase [Kitasatospora sp. NPDC002040]|uniref:serine/threonine-protein kinase n=1 Tax=Kitasatospora sp. NPDC002040 TaxID=3154661 RepID=UPI00331E82F1